MRKFLEQTFSDLEAGSRSTSKTFLEEFLIDGADHRELLSRYFEGGTKAKKKYDDHMGATIERFEKLKWLVLTGLSACDTVLEFRNCFKEHCDAAVEFQWGQYRSTPSHCSPTGKTLINHWKALRSQYPELASWALKQLSVPLSSACVERAFSVVTRRQQDSARNRQSASTFCNEIYVSVNRWVVDKACLDYERSKEHELAG